MNTWEIEEVSKKILLMHQLIQPIHEGLLTHRRMCLLQNHSRRRIFYFSLKAKKARIETSLRGAVEAFLSSFVGLCHCSQNQIRFEISDSLLCALCLSFSLSLSVTHTLSLSLSSENHNCRNLESINHRRHKKIWKIFWAWEAENLGKTTSRVIVSFFKKRSFMWGGPGSSGM